jgi:putative DNA primase/helicase
METERERLRRQIQERLQEEQSADSEHEEYRIQSVEDVFQLPISEIIRYVPKEFVTQCAMLGAHGDGQIMGAIFGGKILYLEEPKEWYLFAGTHWKLQTEDTVARLFDIVRKVYTHYQAQCDPQGGVYREIDRRVESLLGPSGQNAALNQVIRLNHGGIAKYRSELPRKTYLLATQNRVINLRTLIAREGRPEDYLFSFAPVQYDPGAKCPRFELFLREIFGGDEAVIRWILRLFGYSLLGTCEEHIFPIFYGSGGNGKTKLVLFINHILGDSLCQLISTEMLMEAPISNPGAPSPHLMELRDLRVAYATESRDGKLDTAMVKRLTGGDKVKARGAYEKLSTTFLPSHTALLLSNNKPRIPAEDEGIWRRAVLVPFEQSFVHEPEASHEHPIDERLMEKLEGEASGALNLLLAGLREYHDLGLRPLPPTLEEATRGYRREEDWALDYVEDRCEVGKDFRVSAGDLYQDFTDWAPEHLGKRYVPSQKRFGSAVGHHFERLKTHGTSVYLGLKLKG